MLKVGTCCMVCYIDMATSGAVKYVTRMMKEQKCTISKNNSTIS